MRTHLEKIGALSSLRVCLIILFLLTTAVSSSKSNADLQFEAISADNQETNTHFTTNSFKTNTLVDQSCATLPANGVSWWSGEGHAQDAVSGNHGTLQGGATFTTGKVSQAFDFDGVDDFVSIPFNENYNNEPLQDSDYYFIDLSTSGTITINVTDFLTETAQVLLYYQSTANLIDHVPDQPDGNYTITYNGIAGKYYIRVVAKAGHKTGNGEYTLQVNYP